MFVQIFSLFLNVSVFSSFMGRDRMRKAENRKFVVPPEQRNEMGIKRRKKEEGMVHTCQEVSWWMHWIKGKLSCAF